MVEERLGAAAVRAAIQKAGARWIAGETSISTLPPSEQRRRLGVLPPPGAPTLEQMVAQAKSGMLAAEVRAPAAPAAFDLRNASGGNYVTPIKDQGGCGSCVAFGTAAAIEATFRWQRQDPNFVIDLSEAQLFYCYARDEGQSCSTGWWPHNALEHVKNTGVADEACFPYTDHDQDCSGRCADWQNRATKISGYTALTNQPAQMKEWLSTRGALSACFVVFNDFFSYAGGVYSHVTGDEAGGHCVSLVGYDDGQGCWIAKNSWGTGWGEGGFFRIAYGQCSIEAWEVHGVDGIVETGWLNNTKVVGLWAINEDRNAWAYLDGIGWRRIAFDNDVMFSLFLTQLAAAKAANRPVNVYQDGGVIKQVYVF